MNNQGLDKTIFQTIIEIRYLFRTPPSIDGGNIIIFIGFAASNAAYAYYIYILFNVVDLSADLSAHFSHYHLKNGLIMRFFRLAVSALLFVVLSAPSAHF